ncbi:MAG: histidine phosphatase family protein [Patescibacteria group bacterium]|jgi:broad specificity phosphatase PhoE
MLNIYLVRHGQDQDNARAILNGHRDNPLTALGRKQAKELSLTLKKMGVDFMASYVSPLKRARETADIITTTLKLKKAKIMPDLIERDFGIMSGKPIADIVSLCAPQVLKTEETYYFLNPYGAETFPQLLKRGRKVLSEIKKKHKDGNILLVAHGDISKMIFSAYYHLDWASGLKMIHFRNSDALLLSPKASPKKAYISKKL